MENPKEEELKVLTEAAEKLGISMEDISRDPRTRWNVGGNYNDYVGSRLTANRMRLRQPCMTTD